VKVAIDVSQIVYGTGVSRYTIELVKNLLKIDGSNEYVLFAGTLRRKDDILKIFPQTKVFPIPPTLGDFIWNKLHVFPVDKLIGKVDVLHTSDWTEPPSKAFKVTTVHDLIPIKFPRITPPVILAAHRQRLKWIARESKRIIVPSINTKRDLVELGFDESIVRVTSEATSYEKADEKKVEETKRKYLIYDDYIISIGTKPWKNTDRIIRSYHLSKFGKNLKLVIVGERKGTDFKDERGVRYLGYVNEEDLRSLLTGAKVLVFPSLYEGFGIPILDAFACGTPVVTSNISSMPEVAGDAAVLVDPYDINSIADGIKKALDGPKSLIEKGTLRVKDFSWQKTARATLDVYNEAKI
jgi:glycosyltransferase involved in cell wall biosynthesis